jgi:hypothetical protein
VSAFDKNKKFGYLRCIFVEGLFSGGRVQEKKSQWVHDALLELRGDVAGGSFESRREAARMIARLTRHDFAAAGPLGLQVAAALRECWARAVDALGKSPRDARVASELKALGPALAVAEPGALRELVGEVLGVNGLPDSTRDALRKELDKALVIAGREERIPRSARNDAQPRLADPELSEGEGSTLQRHPERSEGSSLQNQITICGAAPLALYCRAGLEDLVVDALRLHKLNARTAGRGLVIVNMGADAGRLRPSPFAVIQGIRFWHDAGFVFPFSPCATLDEIATLIAGPMARALTPFGVRARFDWQASRAENWDLAARLARLGSVLINAPREADWDLMIDQMAGRIVARPKSWFDLRFDYRERDVPASSHAPLAAALAWLAHHLPRGRTPSEEVPSPGKVAGTNAIFPGEGRRLVVWDPFCGAGTELIEAGLLNPHAQLIGSDLDPRAIEAASHNARRAGVKVNWSTGDFRQIAKQIGPVDVILTNPPLGRRVAAGEALALADELIVLAARKLAPGKGRMVWVAPDPARAAVAATRAGLRIQSTRHVDLGGFDGEIQILVV